MALLEEPLTVSSANRHDNSTATAVVEKSVGKLNDEKITVLQEEEEKDATDEAPPPPLPFSKARCIALVLTTTGASFLNSFSVQGVVIILPDVAKELNIPDSRQQWLLSAYTLTYGCFLLFWGRVADLYSKKLVFTLGCAWIAISTAANPVLPNEIAFDVFRGMQGIGAAASMPTALGILGTTFPPGKAKTYAFSVYAAGAPIGAVMGNPISGVLATYANWKWAFWVMAIMAAIVTVAAILVIPPPEEEESVGNGNGNGNGNERPKAKETIDWVGAVLITVGMLCLLFALTEGNVSGWGTPWISALIVVAVVLMAVFVAWQVYLERKTARAPMVKISMFSNARLSTAMVIMALFWASFNGYMAYVTFFYQDYQGLSSVQTALRFLPQGAAGLLTVCAVSRLLQTVPTYAILLVSTLCVSVSSLLLAVPIPHPEDTAAAHYFAYGFWAMALSSMGADTAFPSLTLFVSHALPAADQAVGGALLNAVGQFGRSIGLAVATAAQTAVMARERDVDVRHAGSVLPDDGPSLAGLRAANWINFSYGLAAFLIVALAFRGSGAIGKPSTKKTKTERTVTKESRNTEA